ncbi:MAG: CDP-alcohol phosphatidyltransferase family protein [Elusimicrobiales bacterium]
MVIGIWNPANALTLAGCALAALSAFFTLANRPSAAVICLLWSGVCDLYDGTIAKARARTDFEKSFGFHLDSIVDMAAFGLAPAVLLRGFWLQAPADAALLAGYCICAAARLAYFNALAASGGGEGYRGLPVTFAAWIFPAALLARLFMPATAFIWWLRAATAAAAFLFILDFHIPRLSQRARAVLAAVAALLTIVWL